MQNTEIGGKGNAREPLAGPSRRGLWLAASGALGLIVSAVLATLALVNSGALAFSVAIVLYLAGVVALILVTSGRVSGWAKWPLRLGAPAPPAILVWLALRAFGL